jgi:hypothetical protein
MGLLKKIGKSVKRVFKGVKKVFKKASKFVGRAMKSPWGKALMIAAVIFTAGAAAGVWGGFGAASAAGGSGAASTGFFGKIIGGAKTMFTGGKAAATVAASNTATGMVATPMAQIGAEYAASVGLPGAAAAAAPAAAAGGAGAAGMMAKAAGAVGKFAMSPGGGMLAGNALAGYAQGKAQQEILDQEEAQRRYYDEAWRDPSKVDDLMRAASGDINVPLGFMNRARRVTEFLDQRANAQPLQPTMTPGGA